MLFMLWTLLMNFTDLNWHIANIKMTIRKWLAISVGCDCRSSRNPPPPGGTGLAGGCIGYCWPWGCGWSACDEEVEEVEDSCAIRVWIGGLEESLPGCTRMPRWRPAFGNQASSVVAFCLSVPASTGKSWPSPDEEGHVRVLVNVPQGGLPNLS